MGDQHANEFVYMQEATVCSYDGAPVLRTERPMTVCVWRGDDGIVHVLAHDDIAPHATPIAPKDLRVTIAARDFGIRAPHRPRKKPDKPTPQRGTTARARVRVSIGLAGPTARRPDPAAVLRAADRALYRAKRAGRNRLVRG